MSLPFSRTDIHGYKMPPTNTRKFLPILLVHVFVFLLPFFLLWEPLECTMYKRIQIEKEMITVFRIFSFSQFFFLDCKWSKGRSRAKSTFDSVS
jgi:hypothetical protein